MSRYAVLFPVSEQMDHLFSEKDLQKAARVFFFMHVGFGFPAHRVNTNPEELLIGISEDVLHGGRVFRVLGDVQE